MKLKEALIAYNPGTDQIRVGPLLSRGQSDWTAHPIHYRMTIGAAFTEVREMDGMQARHRLMSDFIGVVVRDRVDMDAAHREFLKIEEYREAIPADMDGASPSD